MLPINHHRLIQIRQLIENSPFIKPEELTEIPGSYAILQQACVNEELGTETKKLKKLFNLDIPENTIKEKFLHLCLLRDQVNPSTYLSYSAILQGHCNRLYWEIALLLFSPTNLQEMVNILMPSVKKTLTFDYQYNPTSSSPKNSFLLSDRVNVSVSVENNTDILANNQCKLTMLSEFIFSDGILFAPESIARLPFALQIKIHDLLANYPNIKEKLYAHNPAFKQLKFDIEWNVKPNEALDRFIFDLKRSGTGYTGHHFASNIAFVACAQFREYLDRLPEDFYNTLLELQDDKIKLTTVLNNLQNGDCVIVASENLRNIQKVNQIFLNQPHNDSKQIRKQIEQRYRTINGGDGLPVTGNDPSINLPVELKRKAYKDIKITSTADVIDMLLNLPDEEIKTLFEYATVNESILTHELASALEMFTAGKRFSIFTGVIEKMKKKFNKSKVLRFAIICKDTSLLKQILDLYEQEKLLTILRKKGKNLLHLVIKSGNVDMLRLVVDSYPVNKRLPAMQEKSKFGETALHLAVRSENVDMLRLVLESYPMNKRLLAMQEKHKRNGNNALHLAIEYGNIDMLRLLLESYPINKRLRAIKEKSKFGGTALHLAVKSGNVDMLRLALESYPINRRLSTIQKKNKWTGENALLIAVKSMNIEMLRLVFELYPMNKRFPSMLEKDKHGATALHWAISNGKEDVLHLFFEQMPEKNILSVLNEEKYSGSGQSRLAYMLPQTFQHFENYFREIIRVKLFIQLYLSISQTENKVSTFLDDKNDIKAKTMIDLIQQTIALDANTMVKTTWELVLKHTDQNITHLFNILDTLSKDIFEDYQNEIRNSQKRKRIYSESDANLFFSPNKQPKYFADIINKKRPRENDEMADNNVTALHK